MDFSLSVPANLLLAGEYFVTEEGGLGLALAASPRARLRVRSGGGGGLSLEGRMGPNRLGWKEGAEAPPLVAACLDEVRSAIALREGSRKEPRGPTLFGAAALELDSSAFFAPDGSKRGFGSSAAVALCLVAALLRLAGLEGEELEEAVFPLALRAHRRAQGGRGSGYDVAASRFGGLGLFRGGELPTWEPAPPRLGDLFGDLRLSLRRGPAPVSSPAALGRLAAWKAGAPEAWARLRSESAELVARLAAAGGPGAFLEALGGAAELGERLGEAIGVPARAPAVAEGGTERGTVTANTRMTATGNGGGGAKVGTVTGQPKAGAAPGTVTKCIGAGDELILVARLAARTAAAAVTVPESFAARPGAVTVGAGTVTALTAAEEEPLLLENEGLRWE